MAVVFTAQEILIGNADYPTEKIAETTRRFRELGLGYANLGALLMALGVPYDSDEGRAMTASITALMTGAAYVTSARTAARMGPFAGFHENSGPMLDVLRMHRREVAKIDEEQVPDRAALRGPRGLGHRSRAGRGARRAQLPGDGARADRHDLVPDGLRHDGIEPDLGLVKTKKLVGGGTMSIVNQTVPRALKRLGYSPDEVDGDRRLHRRAQDDRGRAESPRGASAGIRLFDGRQHDPLSRPREDDGGGTAVHLGRDLQDGEPPRGGHGRRDRAVAHRRLADGSEGGRHLPRQLQGRPADCNDETGGSRSTARG